MFRLRQQYGIYDLLLPELCSSDKAKYIGFFRFKPSEFDDLLVSIFLREDNISGSTRGRLQDRFNTSTVRHKYEMGKNHSGCGLLKLKQKTLFCFSFISILFHRVWLPLRELHWLRVLERIDYKLAVLVNKCLDWRQSTLPANFFALQISINGDGIPGYSTVSSSTIGGRAFPVITACVWNRLPPNVTSLLTLQAFKKNFKTELIARSYTGNS